MRQHKIPLGWFLGLTLATVVISLPLGPTLGKYVWDEQEESINLEVTPRYYPPTTDYNLSNIFYDSISSLSNWTPGQSSFSMCLTAYDSYQLPTSIQVTVDGQTYSVPDGGSSGVKYDADNGYVFIPGYLLTENPSHISISAVAVLIPIEPPAEIPPTEQNTLPTAPVQQPQTTPAEPSGSSEPADMPEVSDPIETTEQTGSTELTAAEEPSESSDQEPGL